MLFATGTIAAKKFGLVGWALALGFRPRTGVHYIRRRRERFLGGGCPAPLGTPTAIPPALGLTFIATTGALPILLAGTPAPPPSGGGPTFGTTVSGLGVGGSKELLASLEQTTSLSRLTSPLTSPRIAASWMWAQGSG